MRQQVGLSGEIVAIRELALYRMIFLSQKVAPLLSAADESVRAQKDARFS